MPRTRLVVLLLLVVFCLSACNTVRRCVQDVRKAGGELEDAAD